VPSTDCADSCPARIAAACREAGTEVTVSAGPPAAGSGTPQAYRCPHDVTYWVTPASGHAAAADASEAAAAHQAQRGTWAQAISAGHKAGRAARSNPRARHARSARPRPGMIRRMPPGGSPGGAA